MAGRRRGMEDLDLGLGLGGLTRMPMRGILGMIRLYILEAEAVGHMEEGREKRGLCRIDSSSSSLEEWYVSGLHFNGEEKTGG